MYPPVVLYMGGQSSTTLEPVEKPGILFVVFPIAGIGLLVFDCPVGIYLAYQLYKGILKEYS